MKLKKNRGDLTDVSAKKEALPATSHTITTSPGDSPYAPDVPLLKTPKETKPLERCLLGKTLHTVSYGHLLCHPHIIQMSLHLQNSLA